MECPNCGRDNLTSALRCDCGYNFQKKQEPEKSLKEQAMELRGGINQRYKEDRFSDVPRDAHASAQSDSHVATSDEPSAGFERTIVAGVSTTAEKGAPPHRKEETVMKNLTILGAAAFLALGLYYGLRESSTPAPPPPPTSTTPDSSPNPVTVIEIHLEDIRQVVRSIEEAFSRTAGGAGNTGYEDIARHANEVVDLAQQLRSEPATLSGNDSRVIGLLVDHIQHAAHELKEAAEAHEHEDSHHAFDNLKYELESLGKEMESLFQP